MSQVLIFTDERVMWPPRCHLNTVFLLSVLLFVLSMVAVMAYNGIMVWRMYEEKGVIKFKLQSIHLKLLVSFANHIRSQNHYSKYFPLKRQKHPRCRNLESP